jgi:enoyl-CoA hydratase/carnithine racemase
MTGPVSGAAVSVEYLPSHTALLTIQRPEARNAVNAAVTQALAKAIEETEADSDVWAVVLTGAGGRAFCAGADIKDIAAGKVLQLRTERGGFAGLSCTSA